MSTITFDFRHHYQRGERRESEQIAYQWDLGHVMEVFVPEDATYTIGYCFGDYEKTEDYAIDTKVQEQDGSYKLTAHIPNKYFERSLELRVYVVGSADDHIITTYEGFITIRGRIQPDDYVDDDPENGATQIIDEARKYATKSQSYSVGGTGTREGEDTDNAKYYKEQAEAVAESIPEDYSELSEDVDQLKNALNPMYDTLNFILNDEIVVIDNLHIENGVIVNGSKASSDTRLISDSIVLLGRTLLFYPGTNTNDYTVSKYLFDGTFISSSGWVNAEMVDTDGADYVILCFREHYNSEISPSNFDATLKYSGQIINDIAHNTDKINTVLDIVSQPTPNLNTAKEGWYKVNASTGAITASSNYRYWCMSEHIDCKPNTMYKVTNYNILPKTDKTKQYVLFINSDNSTSGNIVVDSNNQVRSPANAVKMVAWVYNSVADLVVSNDTHIMIEEGYSYVNGYLPPSSVKDYVARSKIKSDEYDLYYVDQLKREIQSSIRVGSAIPIVTILHFSDTHTNKYSIGRISDIIDNYSDYIDDSICTGDVVNDSTDAMTFWDATKNMPNVMLSIGNHELGYDDGGVTKYDVDPEIVYAKYIDPYISNWNVTSDSGLCYYYKDYANSKLRLIVLHPYISEYSSSAESAQNTWLENVLADALENGYAVICANHFPPNNNKIVFDCNFSPINPKLSSGFPDIYLSTIQSFINSGGEFVCHICGHTHCDGVVYNSNYPNQLFVTVACATIKSQEYCDFARTKGMVSEDCLNLLCIDTYSKIIKIVRIGANMDRYLRSRKTLTISYGTKDTNGLPTIIGFN